MATTQDPSPPPPFARSETLTAPINSEDRDHRHHHQPPSSPSSSRLAMNLDQRAGREVTPLAPPLGDLHIDMSPSAEIRKQHEHSGRGDDDHHHHHVGGSSFPSSSSSSSSTRHQHIPHSSGSGCSDRGIKRRRRSSCQERGDEMRRLSMKRCLAVSNIGNIDQCQDEDQQQPPSFVRDHHHGTKESAVSADESVSHAAEGWTSADSSSIHTSIGSFGSSSSWASSTLDDGRLASTSSYPALTTEVEGVLPPTFTCPFTNVRSKTAANSAVTITASPGQYELPLRDDRRNSSISSQRSRAGSEWSMIPAGKQRDTTIPSMLSSPSTSFTGSSSAMEKRDELRPFPTDRLPMDIINLILDHVLGGIFEHGHNGRWKDKRGQEEDKVHWVRSLKCSATTHLRFALVHRSWTPHVLKSLYRFPRLTSKESIEKFGYCLSHPLELWGTELLADGTIGGVVGDRSRYTRLMTYCVGRGRHSATDYLMWSGTWFAKSAGKIMTQLPNSKGWECEGWCSKGCEETRDVEIFHYPPEKQLVLRHLSILRSPLPADILHLTISTTKDLRALELLDTQKHFIIGNNLNHLKDALKLATNLEIFAMKVDGVVEQEGVLDDIFQLIPSIRHLSLQADLLSIKVFEKTRPASLQSIMIGFAARSPVLFHGKKALDALWSVAKAELIWGAARRQAQNVYQEGAGFPGAIIHRMTLNSTSVSIIGPGSGYGRPYATGSHESLVTGHPSQTTSPSVVNEHSFSSPESSAIPQLGLEGWLNRELSNAKTQLAKQAVHGDEALAVYTSYTHHTPI